MANKNNFLNPNLFLLFFFRQIFMAETLRGSVQPSQAQLQKDPKFRSLTMYTLNFITQKRVQAWFVQPFTWRPLIRTRNLSCPPLPTPAWMLLHHTLAHIPDYFHTKKKKSQIFNMVWSWCCWIRNVSFAHLLISYLCLGPTTLAWWYNKWAKPILVYCQFSLHNVFRNCVILWMEPIIVVGPNRTRFRFGHKIFELGQEHPIPFMKPS